MKKAILIAFIFICGCRRISVPDAQLAREQNPAMAKYADTHNCRPRDEWKPVQIVRNDGSVATSVGKIFYDCPGNEDLIMDFKPESAEPK